MSEEKNKKSPKLRSADKVPPPYPLGKFPNTFALEVGKQVIYNVATKNKSSIEGPEWEYIFANAIGADWKPSSIGLDDIVLDNCAWSAKSVKASNPWKAKTVRLISGRNSPTFSYDSPVVRESDPYVVGEQILEIWNYRVESLQQKYRHLRTVVLIKSQDLLKLTVFEIETVRYVPNLYDWHWNKNNNLEGYRNGVHHFTWQPHGSQFTIKEPVPEQKLCLALKQPKHVNVEDFLKVMGFDNTWVRVVNNG